MITGNLEGQTIGLHNPKENQAVKVNLMSNPSPLAQKSWEVINKTYKEIQPNLVQDFPILGPY